MVDPLGCVTLLGEAVEPPEGDADEDEPPPVPPELPPLEPPEDPCAQAAPAIRHPATSAVDIVR